MNILLTVARFNLGGAESYTCELALELQKRGVNVCVLSGGGRLVHKLNEAGIRHYFFPIKLSLALAGRYIA
ncbi:MAG: hypothetical protein PHS41_02705, partial [Victivallaceae bacterium]|nr:hypothetical protein [Victivallaceae bacterium]